MEKPISVRVIDDRDASDEYGSYRHETYSGGRFRYVAVRHNGTEKVTWVKLDDDGYSIGATTDWADLKDGETWI